MAVTAAAAEVSPSSASSSKPRSRSAALGDTRPSIRFHPCLQLSSPHIASPDAPPCTPTRTQPQPLLFSPSFSLFLSSHCSPHRLPFSNSLGWHGTSTVGLCESPWIPRGSAVECGVASAAAPMARWGMLSCLCVCRFRGFEGGGAGSCGYASAGEPWVGGRVCQRRREEEKGEEPVPREEEEAGRWRRRAGRRL